MDESHLATSEWEGRLDCADLTYLTLAKESKVETSPENRNRCRGYPDVCQGKHTLIPNLLCSPEDGLLIR